MAIFYNLAAIVYRFLLQIIEILTNKTEQLRLFQLCIIFYIFSLFISASRYCTAAMVHKYIFSSYDNDATLKCCRTSSQSFLLCRVRISKFYYSI